ncbi:ABC transporter ATP-binding protein [Paenibacillus sp. J31TS4]|uniref:ABC-F family ATP-binding cassette domain-containing protein n=1 Tax=Paenibacillus sp. J31TS4 TaxID=2807195 RepID=UPI001B1D3E7C|nr:ABC-F family ATP-binding cassette domain-containing protein [Paenibacillus sp. J31TS4]GIP37290.1 ABC transporter ATP-binding protein [Paenibacillus sp. J31TS4]
MHLLSAEGLVKSYGTKVLFDGISFSISEGQRIGLIGVNGTGKTSLLRVLAGLEPPDAGSVIHANRFRADYLPQSPEFEPGTTVLDYLFQADTPVMRAVRDYELALHELERDPDNGRKQAKLFEAQSRMDTLGAWEASTQAKTILSKLGIDAFAQDASLLSGGQRKRVALAAALLHPADLLILDEPTNHIDNETVEWLEEYLSRYRGALLLVTHDRYFLDRVANRILELDRGKLYSYDGNYGVFLEKKAEREEQEAASESKRQNLLRRELAWLHRGAKARTTKQKARIQRAEDLMEQGPGKTDGELELAVTASRLGKQVIELEGVSKTLGGSKLIDGFDYIVMPRDRIGVIGRNGSGKSTLLRLLAGELQPDEGRLVVGQTVKLAFYKQETLHMDESMRVIEYIKEAAETIRLKDGSVVTASQMLERFLFSSSAQWTQIGRLSGGERRRLYLLRTLMGEPNVLLLDEPTNDLDIETLTILEEYLEQFPGAVITVSHDRYFLDKTADRLFAFEGEGRIRLFEGGYSDYLERKRAEDEQAVQPDVRAGKGAGGVIASGDRAGETPESGGAKPHGSRERARRLSYKEQKEWEIIEERIAELEHKVEELRARIAEAGSDFGAVQTLFEEERLAAEELERTTDRWAELAELVEEIERSKEQG